MDRSELEFNRTDQWGQAARHPQVHRCERNNLQRDATKCIAGCCGALRPMEAYDSVEGWIGNELIERLERLCGRWQGHWGRVACRLSCASTSRHSMPGDGQEPTGRRLLPCLPRLVFAVGMDVP